MHIEPDLSSIPELYESDKKLAELQKSVNALMSNLDRIYSRAKKSNLIQVTDIPETACGPARHEESIVVYDTNTNQSFVIVIDGDLKSPTTSVSYSLLVGAPGYFHGVVSGRISRKFRCKLFKQLEDYMTDLTNEPDMKQIPPLMRKVVMHKFVAKAAAEIDVAKMVESVVNEYVESKFSEVPQC